MPQQVLGLNQVLFAQEFIAANSFYFPIEVVDVHVRLWIPAPLAPCQNPCREDRRHTSRRRWMITPRSIHQYHVPIHLVQVIWEVIDPKLAVGEQQVLYGSAFVVELLPGRRDELLHLAHLGRVLDVVCFHVRVFFFEFHDVVLAFVEEDRSSVVIQGFP
uniref:Uncharacterized protein n=1 Tax=Nelumbo nucifera TaxID=4432 RepID=A0A822Z9V3_NELNU|nr:TPA_asm: hypothetical protein HUJ06_015666 [Nelumbo nucifera]